MTRSETPGIKKELSSIPVWAYVIAACFFLVLPAVFYTFAFRGQTDSPMAFIGLFPGTILAFLTLMTGYVNRDAGRRGMNRALWTILVILIPNAIGFILYFLLRNPIQEKCPKCGCLVNLSVNFCPSCRHSFHPTCKQCRAPVKRGDTFCANCGAEVEKDV